MSEKCELCVHQVSNRVFPCLYHCKKMLCIQHLSEHEKSVEKQLDYHNQLDGLWKDYSLRFNEKNLFEQFLKLKTKLFNFQKLKEETKELLAITHLQDSMENVQRFEKVIQRVQQAMDEENTSKMLEHGIHLKIESVTSDEDSEEQQQQAIVGNAFFTSSITTDEESETIDSIPSANNPSGNPPSEEDGSEQMDDFEDHETPMDEEEEEDYKDETSITPTRHVAATKVHGYCPLTHDGAYGISSVCHGVRLCPHRSSQCTRNLYQHFRIVHHLTTFASLTLARAVGSEQDPSTTKLFSDHHIILNFDELRTIHCPIQKAFSAHPTLQIENFPCDTIKQVRHLKEHLKRVHRFSNQAANLILKSVKSNIPVNKIQFPKWCAIIENGR